MPRGLYADIRVEWTHSELGTGMVAHGATDTLTEQLSFSSFPPVHGADLEVQQRVEFDPFAEPSANGRSLRTAVIGAFSRSRSFNVQRHLTSAQTQLTAPAMCFSTQAGPPTTSRLAL